LSKYSPTGRPIKLPGWFLLQLASIAAWVLLAACNSDSTSSTPAASIEVTPTSVNFSSRKEARQLTAVALDAQGQVIEGKAFIWSTSSISVATVASTGFVTAEADGNAEIRASADGLTATAAVTVQQVATQLVLLQSPDGGPAGATLSPTTVVRVGDANGFPVTSSSITVSMGLDANPSGGTLSGTTSSPVSQGTASFADLSVDVPGAGFTLRATAMSLAPVVSGVFDVCLSAPPNLLAWWSGDGDANDEEGAFHGTLNGAISFDSGLVGEAFEMKAVGDYVAVPNASGLNPSQISVAAWVKASNQLTAFDPVVKKVGGTLSPNAGYGLEFAGDRITFTVFTLDGTFATDSVPVTPGMWTHLVGVYAPPNLWLSVNGVSAVTKTTTGGWISSTRELRIGGDPFNPGRGFNGLIDEVMIFDRPLGQAEISQMVVAGAAGVCK